jgi:hypothetical protein
MQLTRARVTQTLLLLVLTSCGSPDAETAETVGAWSVTPQPLTTIGNLDGAAEYLFDDIQAVRQMHDGSILVADGSETIRSYTRDGAFRQSWGRQGEGPGEFVDLYYLAVLSADTILAYDVEQLRYTMFSATGGLLSTQQIHPVSEPPFLYFGTYANGDHALAWLKAMERDPAVITADQIEVRRFGRDGTAKNPLGMMTGIRRLRRMAVPFSPVTLATMVADTLFLSDGVGGLIAVVGPDGVNARTMRIETDPVVAEEAWLQLEQVLDSTRLERMRAQRAEPGTDSIPAFSEILADDSGQLWVKTFAPSTDSPLAGRRRTGGTWLVIRTDGTVVARIGMPEGFRLLDVRGNRAAGFSTDSLGVQRVHVYGIAR